MGARRRGRLGSLRRQFDLAIAIAVGQLLVGTVVFTALMFVSTEDALLIGLMVAFAGVVAVRAAGLFGDAALRDVTTVRDALVAVGSGVRDARIATSSRDEIAQLAAAANVMVERLAASEAARRDLVAAVSHDLRTPLTSLRLLADAIGDEIVDEATRRRYLATMTTHIAALGALIDDLFELTRLEAGDIEWSMERVRVDELVDETVAAMRAQVVAGVGHDRDYLLDPWRVCWVEHAPCYAASDHASTRGSSRVSDAAQRRREALVPTWLLLSEGLASGRS